MPLIAQSPAMLDLQRPMVYISIESTGLDVEKDRVVELAMIKVHPSGQVRHSLQGLCHPCGDYSVGLGHIHKKGGMWLFTSLGTR